MRIKLKFLLFILSLCIIPILVSCNNNSTSNNDHTHSYVEFIISPTCTEKGYILHRCECGKEFIDNISSSLGHDLGDWEIKKYPTETEEGVKIRRCSRCNYEESCYIPFISHTHIFNIKNIDSKYIKSDATCTEKAQYYYSCSCGEKGSETFEYGKALNHSFTNYVSDNNATCTKDGTKTAKCDRCAETNTITETGSKLNHSFTNYISDHNATCTKDGTKTAKCDCCNETDTVIDIDSRLGHEFTNYVSDNNATYEKDGTKTAHCNREGCTATNTIPDEGTKLESKMSFKTLSVGERNADGNISVYGKVPNAQKTYSFIDEIIIEGVRRFVVSTDVYGMHTVVTKTIPLFEGDNKIFVIELNGEDVKSIYEVTIRRRKIYTVSFNLQGGSAIESQQIEEDSLAIQPASPTKKGYTFNKWAFDFSTPITKNIEIIAEWDIIHYNIYYNLNGGIISGNLPISYTVEDEITLTLYPTKEYYEFNFWSNEGKILKGSTEDKSFEAFFTPIEYNISYDCGNGINNDGNKSTYNIEDNIKLLDPYYINADFIEWQKDGESISEIPVGSHGDISLTSIWKDYDIKLSLNQDGETYTVIGLNKPNLTVLNILPYYKNKAVIIIKEYAFRDCSKLYRVKIPDTVQIIGRGAFSGCTTLRELTIPFVGKSRNVDYVYEGCLGYIFDYTSTTDPTYSQIDKYNCLSTTKEIYYKESYFYFKVPTSLVIVDILEGIESLNEYAFYNYPAGLSVISIPTTVKEIKETSIGGTTESTITMASFYYKGTEKEWDIIKKPDFSNKPNKIKYYSEDNPFVSGKYWHYNSYGNIESW